MRRFRIIESRTVSTKGDKPESVPYFYIEEAENFLFFTVWNRFLSGFSEREMAEELIKAMTDASEFKEKII